MWPLIGTGVLALVGFSLAWYYRNKALGNAQVAEAVAEHAREIAAAHEQTLRELNGALKKIKEYQDDEAANDTVQASKVVTAADASNFLADSLPKPGTGPGAYSATPVPLARGPRRSRVIAGFVR